MGSDRSGSPDADATRKRAEERLRETSARTMPAGATERRDLERLVHELEVHQIELEMQNEELQRARSETAALQETYLDLFDFAPVGYFTLDADGVIRKANLTGASLLGKAREELDGRRFGLLLAPESRPAFTDFLACVMSGRHGLECDVSLDREGGEVLHVLLGGKAFEAIPGCRVTMMDVTQRRSAAEELARQRDHLGLLNEALRESEEKYRTVADFTYDWEAWRAPDGTYRYVSPSCARITGHAAAEFLADPGLVGRITHPDDREKVVDHYRAGAHEARREGQQIDFRILTPGGETRWISHLCTGVHGKDGEWLGRRESNRDITGRKRAEEELRDEHWRMERIIEGTQAGTWEWNVQTGQAAFNEVWAGIIGYTLDELAPVSIKTWESFVHPADLQLSAEQLERHFTGELPSYDCECRMRHKDGHWVWVHDRGRVMTRTDDGRPLTMFGTHTDITLRKQAEEALRESDARFKKLTLHQFVLEWRKSRSSGSGGSGGSRGDG